MTENAVTADRREVLAGFAVLGTVGLSSVVAGQVDAAGATSRPAMRPVGAADFDFLVGSWDVFHRRRRRRLVDDHNWDAFDGTLVNWALLGGLGNVGDNVMNFPAGSFRGIGMRTFDPAKSEWLSWWLDGRNPTMIGEPLRGHFTGGVGTFLANDTLEGKPIKTRVQWSKITSISATWEQSASADDGATWEINWTSVFSRRG